MATYGSFTDVDSHLFMKKDKSPQKSRYSYISDYVFVLLMVSSYGPAFNDKHWCDECGSNETEFLHKQKQCPTSAMRIICANCRIGKKPKNVPDPHFDPDYPDPKKCPHNRTTLFDWDLVEANWRCNDCFAYEKKQINLDEGYVINMESIFNAFDRLANDLRDGVDRNALEKRCKDIATVLATQVLPGKNLPKSISKKSVFKGEKPSYSEEWKLIRE